MEAGRPLIVSDHGSFREFPDDVCLKVPVDEGEGKAFQRAAETLLGDAELRAHMGAAARQFVCRNLRMEDAAARYIEFANEVSAEPGPALASQFPSARGSAVRRAFFSSVYKACRLRYVCRHYGIADIFQRLTRERHAAGAR